MMYSEPEILNLSACLALILSGVICGVIRLFHLCHPYNQKADYFYPARWGTFVFYMGLLLLLPYLLQINNSDSWLYARYFGILYYPCFLPWLTLRYFKGKLRYNSVRHAFIEFPTMMLMLYLLLGTTKLYSITNIKCIPYVVGIWSIVLLAYMAYIIFWLSKVINNYHHQMYSNPDDFPYRFARMALYVPIILVAIMWVVFFVNTREIKFYADILMVIYNVGFLCVILYPQRKLVHEEKNKIAEKVEEEQNNELETIESEEKYISQNNPDKKCKLTPDQLKHYQELVIRELEDNKVYLDNHYTLEKLSKSIFLGRTYTSIVCTSLGGFYNIVNKYRVEFAEQYQKAHPNMTVDAISMESGFKDRKAYHRAKKAISK